MQDVGCRMRDGGAGECEEGSETEVRLSLEMS